MELRELTKSAGLPPELSGCLLEGYREIRRQALTEGILSDFGAKLAKGTIVAAMALGMLAHADAAPRKGGAQVKQAKSAPTVTMKKTVKNTRSGSTTVTKADLKNLTNSDTYQDRVTELLKALYDQNPGMDPDRMYKKACSQAMMEIMEGKLKI